MRYQQPQSAVGVDRSNPLTRGLLTALSLGASGHDSADSKGRQTFINNPSLVPTSAGVGRSLNGSNQTVRLNRIIPPSQTSGTMFVLGWFPAATGGSLAMQSTDAAGNQQFGLINGIASFNGPANPCLPGAASTWPAGLHSYAGTWNPTRIDAFSDGRSPFGPMVGTGPTPAGDINYPFQLGGYHYNGGNIFLAAYTPLLFLLWDRMLSDAEIRALSDNPWQIFKASSRVFAAAAGGPQSYIYTATGGLLYSGTATKLRGLVRAAGGGLLFSGVGNPIRNIVRTSSGGINLSGVSTAIRSRLRTSAGGVLFAGAASVAYFAAVQTRTVIASGGIVFSGAVSMLRSSIKAVSGGYLFKGSAAITQFPDPNPPPVRGRKRGHRPRWRN